MVHDRPVLTKFRFNFNSKKKFRPQTSEDETILADRTYYLWDPEWSHLLFVNIPNNILSAAIATVSVHKD